MSIRIPAKLANESPEILTSDERRLGGPSLDDLIREASRVNEDRQRARAEVGVQVELLLRINLSMVVYGE